MEYKDLESNKKSCLAQIYLRIEHYPKEKLGTEKNIKQRRGKRKEEKL